MYVTNGSCWTQVPNHHRPPPFLPCPTQDLPHAPAARVVAGILLRPPRAGRSARVVLPRPRALAPPRIPTTRASPRPTGSALLCSAPVWRSGSPSERARRCSRHHRAARRHAPRYDRGRGAWGAPPAAGARTRGKTSARSCARRRGRSAGVGRERPHERRFSESSNAKQSPTKSRGCAGARVRSSSTGWQLVEQPPARHVGVTPKPIAGL